MASTYKSTARTSHLRQAYPYLVNPHMCWIWRRCTGCWRERIRGHSLEGGFVRPSIHLSLSLTNKPCIDSSNRAYIRSTYTHIHIHIHTDIQDTCAYMDIYLPNNGTCQLNITRLKLQGRVVGWLMSCRATFVADIFCGGEPVITANMLFLSYLSPLGASLFDQGLWGTSSSSCNILSCLWLHPISWFFTCLNSH